MPRRTVLSTNGWAFPQTISSIGLFRRNTVELPLKSVNLGYRQEKARLASELFGKNNKAVM